MSLMFWNRFVLVKPATNKALVDIGEQRSPKYMPEREAPPSRAGSIPMILPIVMQMTPIVAIVPKDVPVRNDTKQFRRKVMSKKTLGIMTIEE